MPPQDIAAEQGVLGGMMLSKDAIADVVEVLKGVDFYRPAHELIYESILDLYSRGEPADPVTVSAELTNRGELARVGGTPYLHDLISTVPTAANAGFYARIVRERAVLRRLVEAGTRIVQMGYGADGMDVDAIVNSAQAEVYAVTEKRVKEDYAVLGDVIEGAIDEIEASSHRGEGMVGVPTGFADLDGLTNGLHPGQMIVIAARPAVGKALALDTPLPTPTGWTTMGEVRVGDELLGADGRPTRVVAATDVMLDRPCYEVRFSDGSTVLADAQHQWATSTVEEPVAVRTTAELAADLRRGLAHRVETCAPLDLPEADLPEAPYLLGARLSGWTGATSGPDAPAPELVVQLEAEGATGAVQGPAGAVPPAYLRASLAQRRALLAGLLDAAGTVTPSGRVEWSTAEPDVAAGVLELLHSLGHRVSQRHDAGLSTFAFTPTGGVFRLEEQRLQLKEALAGRSASVPVRWVVDVAPVASVPVRCVEVSNDDHLYLAGPSMVPTHNSTLGLDIARAASIKHGLASVIFSLEMGRNEISMRLLSAEARIPLQNMRKGTMREEDWTKLARTMGSISEAPLYIDDSPNMSLMEIRSKCRRLKQRADLKLVIVDYLQLMTSGKRVESRQQEVSEFSRALKLLAKELEVPVIALSQLNRGPEQRTDKKPQMSDLRESGCLTADTRVLRADTGAETSLEELFALRARDVPVWALDDSLRYVRRHLTHVFPTGVKPVFRLRLASGKEVRATANHPFLTYDGWRPLGELSAGDRLAVPRHVPGPERVASWEDDRVLLLAHLIGDGSFVRRQPLRYASVDEANLAAVTEAAASAFGITAVRDEYAAARCTTLRLPAPYRLTHGKRNPIAEWLDDLGLFGLRSYEKFVPVELFHLPKRQVALFLRHIWATDGSVTVHAGGRGGRIYYASTSRRLVEDLSRLLLRFGISTRVRQATPKGSYRSGWTLDVSGADDQRRFLQEIGVHGARGASAERLLDVVRDLSGNPNVDTVPRQVWDDVRRALVEKGMTHREFAAAMGTQFCGSTMWKHAPSRARLARVAEVLGDADLEVMAVNDVLWDEVVAVEPDGEEQVFDATIAGGHNFVANGIAVHNSIEQDADMVILLHREDMYEKESPRAGEADFIVAKHRNGPTDTITVAFQGHYSRFVDMAT
ncbi:replicative DNA helicase [Kineococcus sp. G2]|uniref:replicative DNA helicase n=1 Tax=Kineococcus sp. G2 TaxID=3127484 RepID=UPI00301E3979